MRIKIEGRIATISQNGKRLVIHVPCLAKETTKEQALQFLAMEMETSPYLLAKASEKPESHAIGKQAKRNATLISQFFDSRWPHSWE